MLCSRVSTKTKGFRDLNIKDYKSSLNIKGGGVYRLKRKIIITCPLTVIKLNRPSKATFNIGDKKFVMAFLHFFSIIHIIIHIIIHMNYMYLRQMVVID